MRVIYEGPDGVGKTTMALKHAGKQMTYVHYGCHHNRSAYSNYMQFDTMLQMDDVVFDRSPISELIYAKYRGDRPWCDVGNIAEMLFKSQTKVIFVTANIDTIKNIMSVTEQSDWAHRNIENIHDDYLQMRAMLTANSFHNYETIDNTEALNGYYNGLRNASNSNA